MKFAMECLDNLNNLFHILLTLTLQKTKNVKKMNVIPENGLLNISFKDWKSLCINTKHFTFDNQPCLGDLELISQNRLGRLNNKICII